MDTTMIKVRERIEDVTIGEIVQAMCSTMPSNAKLVRIQDSMNGYVKVMRAFRIVETAYNTR